MTREKERSQSINAIMSPRRSPPDAALRSRAGASPARGPATNIVRVFVRREPLPIERVDLFLLLGALRPLPFWLGYRRSPDQCIQARRRQSPLWRFQEDASARPQDRMGAGQFARRRPNIHTRVV